MLESILRAARAAGDRGRQRRRLDHRRGAGRSRPTTCWRSSCRASSCTGPRPCTRWPGPCSTSPPTISTGTLDGRLRRREGADLAGGCRDRQSRRPGRSRGCSTQRARALGGSSSRSASRRRGSSACVDGVLVRRGSCRAADRAPAGRRGPAERRAQRRQRARRQRARRHAYGVDPRRDRGRPARVRARPAPQPVHRHAWPASTTSTTARRPTRTRRAASLSAYPRIVWIAGGQLKGAPVDELVAEIAAAARRGRPAGRRP